MARPVVRAFVSSTFLDMDAERDMLVTAVFPELHERLDLLGIDFFDVDLRWGVPTEGLDGEQINSWEYCRRQLDDVDPFFICMLGERYGSPSPPPAAEATSAGVGDNRSVTELEIRHAALADGARHRSFFYFREATVPRDHELVSRYVQPGPDDALGALKAAIRRKSNRVRTYPCVWATDRFVELDKFGEVVLEDLWSSVLRDPRYVPAAVWQDVLGHTLADDPIYADEAVAIPADLWSQIIDRARPAPPDPFDQQNQQMEDFASSQRRWFHGRSDELGALRAFVASGKGPSLAAVLGESGAGKTSLLAALAVELAQTTTITITHFVGATDGPSTLRGLLERLLRELDRHGVHDAERAPLAARPELTSRVVTHDHTFEVRRRGEFGTIEPLNLAGTDVDTLKVRLASRLIGYGGPPRIVLVIDGIGSLDDGHDLAWIPMSTSSEVRIIVSAAVTSAADEATSPTAKLAAALDRRVGEASRIAIGPLDEGSVGLIIKSFLREFCKELAPSDVAWLSEVGREKGPLYLAILLDEARTLGGDQAYLRISGAIRELPGRYHDATELFGWMLKRLEVFGAQVVRSWCTFLAHGRAGMSGRELRDLVTRALGPQATRIAPRIERGLRRHLLRRGSQWDFAHAQLREAVQRYYPPEDPAEQHMAIAGYMAERWAQPDAHAVAELPYHQRSGGKVEVAKATLTDLKFVETKCGLGMTYDLLSDYDAAAGLVGEDDAVLDFRRFVATRAHVLARDPKQVVQEAVNQPATSAVARAAARELAGRSRPHPWIEWINKPTGLEHCEFTLEGHGSDVTDCCFSADGRRIVSASLDGTLRIWEGDTGRCIARLDGHTKGVRACAASPDGRWLASASFDSTVRVWYAETGELARVFTGHNGAVKACAFLDAGRTLVSAGNDGTILVWDAETGGVLARLVSEGRSITRLLVGADNRLIVAAFVNRLVEVWDLKTRERVLTFAGPASTLGGRDAVFVDGLEFSGHSISDCACSPDGARLVTASSLDRALLVHDLATGNQLQRIAGHAGGVVTCAFSPDGRLIGSGSDDTTVRIWSAERGQALGVLRGHSFGVKCCAFSTDGLRIVSGGGDAVLKVWKVPTVSSESDVGGVRGERVRGLAFSPDGRLLASVADDGSVTVADAATGVRVVDGTRLPGVTDCAYSPDSDVLLTSSYDGRLRLLDQYARGGTSYGGAAQLAGCAFSPDGRFVASVGEDWLTVVDQETGAPAIKFKFPARVASCSYSPGGGYLAMACGDGQVHLLNISKTAVDRRYRTSNASAERCAFSPDGRLLAATSGSEVDAWDLRTGQRILTLSEHEALVSDCFFTADAGRLVTASYDKSVRIWQLPDCRLLMTLYGTGFTTLAAGARDTFAAGDTVGRVSLLRMHGVDLGAAYVTAARFYRKRFLADDSLAVRCPRCCARFPVPVAVQHALRKWRTASWTELPPDDAWKDPVLRSRCQHCQHGLHFNPFIADGRQMLGWRARLAQAWRSLAGK
ncbi:MAG: DUF4062 domain-containing protein [Gemmatimonadales bacterium]